MRSSERKLQPEWMNASRRRWRAALVMGLLLFSMAVAQEDVAPPDQTERVASPHDHEDVALHGEVDDDGVNNWMKCWLNLSNVLYVIGYGVRDVLLLRTLAIVAMMVAMPYYIWHRNHPESVPIYWNIGFMLVNAYWIVKILLERRPPKFTPDERKLYEYAFHQSCTPRQMLQLLSKATWETADDKEVIVRRGGKPDQLIFIHEGQAIVRVKNRELARLRDGDVVGEMSFLTDQPPMADVVADGPLRYVRWDREELESLTEQRLELKVAIQRVIGENLVQRLKTSMGSIPELTVNRAVAD